MTVDEAAALEVTHRHEHDLERSLGQLCDTIDAALDAIRYDDSWTVSDRGFHYRLSELT